MNIISSHPRVGSLAAAACLWLILALTAVAHPLLQNAMWIVFAPDRARVAVNVSLREIVVAQELKAEPNAIASDDLDAAARKHGKYLLSHLSLRDNSHDLSGKITKITPPVLFAADPEQTFYQYELEYPYRTTAPPSSIRIAHTMLKEWPYGLGQAWDVTYAVRLKRSDDPTVKTGLLRGGASEEFATGFAAAPGAEAAAAHAHESSFISYLQHGIMHILTGWDHLLFVSALVLATVTFWEMFKVIAAFTLAHTITLATSVLTGFRLPDWFIEPVIAGSIIVVAGQNLLAPKRVHGWLRLAVAFGFGLIHGLGFAGGLRDALGELGTSAVLLALLAFSIGVEVGHQVVVLPVFGVLRLADARSESRFRMYALRYGSAAISIAGAYYLFQAIAAA
jgi:hypothetical protein